MTKFNELFPESIPYAEHRIKVGAIHELHVEEHGNPHGTPIIYVHGGPGGGIDASCARYFDPEKWRIILFDQRGCGKSQPFACLEENTTWELVADMEVIRLKLRVQSWVVFGGSWGSTLALSYAISHATACRGLVLRGIFLGRKRDIYWLYENDGAGRIFPDAWEKFLAPIPKSEHKDLLRAYHARLISSDEKLRSEAAVAWSLWEGSVCHLVPRPETMARVSNEHFALAFARIECHYFTNGCFFPEDNYLINHIHRLKDIPAYIVHGRYDVVCLVEQAWDLHKAWKTAELSIIDTSGHSASEPATQKRLMEVTDELHGRI
jgi:proline iminopeptidase